MKFSPKFHLIKDDGTGGNDLLLPNMPYKQLPKARYPYSPLYFLCGDITAVLMSITEH